MLNKIQRCFRNGKVLYTRHARDEMRTEEFGIIREEEVFESIAIVITAYQPDPSLWLDYKRRRGK